MIFFPLFKQKNINDALYVIFELTVIHLVTYKYIPFASI